MLVVLVVKLHTRRRRNALFACGLMRFFPAISARKGADERKVGFFFQNIETPQKYMRNFRKLPVPIQTAHGYPCAPVSTGGSFLDPQTPRRPLTPPPLFAPDRSSKDIAEPARLRNLRARADAAFPSNIGAKGSRRGESRIFSKHRNAAEVHAELSETASSGTDCPRLSLRACFNRREFLNPQTPRRPFTPPPLSAPNRSSKNIAEPARLRSLRASPLRSLFEAYGRTA